MITISARVFITIILILFTYELLMIPIYAMVYITIFLILFIIANTER